jgi:hydroxyacylglutathione hydrolase
MSQFFTVYTLPVLHDNFSYIIHCNQSNEAAVVDVSEVEPVLNKLTELKVSKFSILTTHKHHDHSGGNEEMCRRTGCSCYGGVQDAVPGCTHPLLDGDNFSIGQLQANVLHTPCHTRGHVLFHVFHPRARDEGALFTGDTLFVGGIGAFFEGNARQMVDALQRVSELPDSTRVYPGNNFELIVWTFSHQRTIALSNDAKNYTLYLPFLMYCRPRVLAELPAVFSLGGHAEPLHTGACD